MSDIDIGLCDIHILAHRAKPMASEVPWLVSWKRHESFVGWIKIYLKPWADDIDAEQKKAFEHRLRVRAVTVSAWGEILERRRRADRLRRFLAGRPLEKQNRMAGQILDSHNSKALDLPQYAWRYQGPTSRATRARAHCSRNHGSQQATAE